MSTVYASTTDTNLCEGSIVRATTRLKNDEALRAVVKQSVDKHSKLSAQSVLELYEVAPWCVS